MLHFKSPLSWPEAIPATPLMKQRSDNGFSANITLTDAVTFLKEEIDLAGIAHAVLYLDMDQPQVERLRKKVGSRTGACLHLKHRDRGYIITCDRWQRMEHNIYAMHLALRQWCNMERWGIGTLSSLMAGFEIDYKDDAAFSAEMVSENIVECLKTFGLGMNATLEDATAIYHRRAKSLAHDSEQLAQLNIAMDEIRSYFLGKDPK